MFGILAAVGWAVIAFIGWMLIGAYLEAQYQGTISDLRVQVRAAEARNRNLQQLNAALRMDIRLLESQR